eukprot:15459719-Alexandrium_andersonii.AAC.1
MIPGNVPQSAICNPLTARRCPSLARSVDWGSAGVELAIADFRDCELPSILAFVGTLRRFDDLTRRDRLCGRPLNA